MTKTELVEAIQSRVEGTPTKREAALLLEDTISLIKESLASGEAVKLSSFGRFETRSKKPRLGRNPKTGEPMLIEARRVVTFSPSPVLRDRMNANGV